MFLLAESTWIGLYHYHDPSPAVEGAPRNAYRHASFLQVVSGIQLPTSYLMVVSNNRIKQSIEYVFLGCSTFRRGWRMFHSRRRGDRGTGSRRSCWNRRVSGAGVGSGTGAGSGEGTREVAAAGLGEKYTESSRSSERSRNICL